MKPLAHRVENISPSMTVSIDNKAKELIASGIDVISLGAGEPDFDTPENIKIAAIQSIQLGKTKYTPPTGILEVKKSIVRKLADQNQLFYTPDQITISNGAKHCISNSLLALINPGDEVIIPSPYWVTYPELVKLYGGIPVIAETDPENGFKLTAEILEQLITQNSKLLILNSPCNPTGSVYTKPELESIAQVLIHHQLYCLSDEIYENIVYGNAKHISIASLNSEIFERTIVVNGVSKAYAMTGWRLGYSAAPEKIARAIGKVQGQTTHHPANPSQWAAKTAMDNGLPSVKKMVTSFENRMKLALELLNKIPETSYIIPAGAFYVFIYIQNFLGRKTPDEQVITDSLQLCNYLLEKHLIAVIPGSAFGKNSYLRISFATDVDSLKKGIQRLEKGLSTLIA